jgi:hypothetical protein
MLADSKFALSREIVAASTWTDAEISERALHLADLAVELWPRPAVLPPPQVAAVGEPLGEVFALADAAGVGDELRTIATTASDLGLYLQQDRYSLMVAPPRDKRVMLFTLWPQDLGGGSFRIWRSSKAFADHVPGVTAEAARALGEDNEGSLSRAEVPDFLDRLGDLLKDSGLAAGPTEWNWDLYARELQVPAERLAIARALVDALVAAVAARDLPWRIVFRKGYAALQRPGA